VVSQTYPTDEYAATDSLPRNLADAETHLPVQDAKRDQQSYPPGTWRVRKSANRIYYLDRHDQLISVSVTTTRHEARPNYGSPVTDALTDQFDSMNIRSNVSEQGEPHRTIRSLSTPSAPPEKACGDALLSSRHASDSWRVSQSPGDDSTNLYHGIPRRASPDADSGMRDERCQPRERPRVAYPQDDNEDDYGKTSPFKSAQDSRRSLPPQQPEYSQSSGQSQRQPKSQVVEDPTVQSHTVINHGRRLSTNQWPSLQVINEGKELRMTKTVECNRGKVEVLDHREFSS
jgi:hypothetical protein